ncbi:hypothetical protein [Micromonospora aurantiaca (nom. illeg.)]|uniref:hypothetical protein n=1 Tax=Micromonospora aurantiaca (nom. illeg.) TaxID=47850 RepID=UPI00082760F3|nr:hypothetical protein [Micromonospora aurantiaca]SCL42152.1 hypothetical protein GA0070615_5325 [Micromonospora aurantiaca]
MTTPTPTDMPGVPTLESLAREAGYIEQSLTAAGQELTKYGATQAVNKGGEHASSARGAIDGALSAIRGAMAEAAKVVDDRRMYPAGRHDQVREIVAKTEAAVREAVERAETDALIAEASAVVAATPPVDTREALIARHDVEMMLGDATRGDFVERLNALIAMDGPAGHLASSEYLRLYLTAKGVEPRVAEQYLAAARRAALAAAEASDDPARRRAAAVAGATPHARKAAAAARASWSQARAHIERLSRRIPKS